MSTPEQPATPPLTRRQLREIRNTGSNPVITPDAVPTGDAAPDTPASPAQEPGPAAHPATTPNGAGHNGSSPNGGNPGGATVAPLPRAAEPVLVPPPPIADSAVDLGVSPLTRRQARQQERIRTASVPVITPEVVAANAAGMASAFAPPPTSPVVQPIGAEPESPEAEDVETADDQPEALTKPAGDDDTVSTDSGVHALFGLPRREPAHSAPDAAPAGGAEEEDDFSTAFATDESAVRERASVSSDGSESGKAVVNPRLGAGLLESDVAVAEPEAVDLPASFDQLLSRSTGSVSTPNALIVSQAPEVAPLVGPITATGEVLVTGTFNLPEGLGSTGHALGTADGKEIDATLIDGELPSHSSPTPIAASAAVSTVKMPGEVIKPPAPEKGSRLMMSLAITAGVLALALVGVLILAFVTGVF